MDSILYVLNSFGLMTMVQVLVGALIVVAFFLYFIKRA